MFIESTAVLMNSVLTHENAWLHFTKWLSKQRRKWGENGCHIAHLLAWLWLYSHHSAMGKYTQILPFKAADLPELADRFTGFFGQFLKLYIQTKVSRVVEDEFNQDLSSKVEFLASNISRNLRRYETFGVLFRVNFVSQFVRIFISKTI